MVMVVNSGRWCLGFLGEDGFPDQLKLWLRIHSDEELRVHMLTQWLVSHQVRGVAWRSPQGGAGWIGGQDCSSGSLTVRWNVPE